MQRGFAGQRDDSFPGLAEEDGVRLHHATQNGPQFMINFFISGIFLLMSSCHS